MQARVATMNSQGRIVIPAQLRRAMGITGPTDLLLRVDGPRIVIETIDTAVAGAQALVAEYNQENRPLVDELIAERRAEAAAE